MPDIAMCSGDGCPMRETCYRAMATPSKYRQSYFATPPFNLSGHASADQLVTVTQRREACEYYYPIKVCRHGEVCK